MGNHASTAAVAADIIADPQKFSAWWDRRPYSRDMDVAIVRAAQAAGLLHKGTGMIVLTPEGNALRKQAWDRRWARA